MREAPAEERDVFFDEMNRINDAVRAEFFAEEIPYGELIYEKAKKYDVDPALVAAVIEQESRFKPRAKSHVGARGLMQLMPRTGRWMGARNLYDPEQNVDAGVKYIKYLDKRFNGDLKKTIAAYNGGEGNVMRYQRHPAVPRDPPVREEGHEELRQAHEAAREVRPGPARRLGPRGGRNADAAVAVAVAQ